MKKLVVLSLLAFALCFAACRRESLPEGVMTEEQMIDFLADAYLLEGFYAVETQFRYDVMPEAVAQRYDSILAAHAVGREQVEQSFDYYSNHLDRYQVIHDSVLARLEAER